jgi:hypothetical protein
MLKTTACLLFGFAALNPKAVQAADICPAASAAEFVSVRVTHLDG